MTWLKNAFCKNIKEYNKKFTERKLNPENGHRYALHRSCSRRICRSYHDGRKRSRTPIARLAQLARAVGIHFDCSNTKTICKM